VEKIGDLAAVVSPPYDVIPDNLRHELHQRHPHNVVRLILGEDRAMARQRIGIFERTATFRSGKGPGYSYGSRDLSFMSTNRSIRGSAGSGGFGPALLGP
jgi:hypothetical protein